MIRALCVVTAFALALLLTFVLTGCNESGMVKVKEVHASTIIWDKRRPTHCGDKVESDGCAEYLTEDRTYCRITMLEDSSDMVIAHEVRHCFGWDHLSPS